MVGTASGGLQDVLFVFSEGCCRNLHLNNACALLCDCTVSSLGGWLRVAGTTLWVGKQPRTAGNGVTSEQGSKPALNLTLRSLYIHRMARACFCTDAEQLTAETAVHGCLRGAVSMHKTFAARVCVTHQHLTVLCCPFGSGLSFVWTF